MYINGEYLQNQGASTLYLLAMGGIFVSAHTHKLFDTTSMIQNIFPYTNASQTAQTLSSKALQNNLEVHGRVVVTSKTNCTKTVSCNIPRLASPHAIIIPLFEIFTVVSCTFRTTTIKNLIYSLIFDSNVMDLFSLVEPRKPKKSSECHHYCSIPRLSSVYDEDEPLKTDNPTRTKMFRYLLTTNHLNCKVSGTWLCINCYLTTPMQFTYASVKFFST